MNMMAKLTTNIINNLRIVLYVPRMNIIYIIYSYDDNFPKYKHNETLQVPHKYAYKLVTETYQMN